MQKYSKNISIYSAQFLSIASILGRITINGFILIMPVMLIIRNINTLVEVFFFKWFLIFVIIYHIFHFWKEVFNTVKGFLGLCVIILIITLLCYNAVLNDPGFIMLGAYIVIHHITFGLVSLFTDYSININSKIRFWTSSLYIIIVSILFTFFLLASFI